MLLTNQEYKKFIETMPVVCIDCLVVNEKNEYLLVKRENEPLKGMYWVPGGRLLKNESLETAVYRKMKQEIGVEVGIIRSLGFIEEFYEKTAQNASGGFHAISFFFLVKPKSFDFKLDHQSSDWGWFQNYPSMLLKYGSLNLNGL